MTLHLKTLFGRNQELRPLLTKVHALSALHSHFLSVAPAYLTQSCQVLGLQGGTLSIAVANATIAAKLRQLAPELAIQMQSRGCEVSGIRVKVQVSYDLPQAKPVPRKLGKSAQTALQNLSLKLGDSPLKQALDKLAKRGN